MDSTKYVANQFACTLLMPEDLFRTAVTENNKVSHLSDLFNVPVKAIKFRAEQLGYIIGQKMKTIIIEKINNNMTLSGTYLSNERAGEFIFDSDKLKAIRFESESLAEMKQFEMQRRKGISSSLALITLDDVLKNTVVLNARDITVITHLTNKVNAVTSYWRHHMMVPPSKLNDLSDAQIKFEEHFKERLTL